MRTTIEVSDLDISQWEWVQTQLRREYQFQTYTPRVCVTFELSEDIAPTHVEMPVREFMLFIEGLATKRKQDIPTFPDDVQEGHDHERPVSLEPSTWSDCPPIRIYADGCRGYGPYTEQGATGPQDRP